MTAVAQVIDESVKNMSRNMVIKSDQEKVRRMVCSMCYGKAGGRWPDNRGLFIACLLPSQVSWWTRCLSNPLSYRVPVTRDESNFYLTRSTRTLKKSTLRNSSPRSSYSRRTTLR